MAKAMRRIPGALRIPCDDPTDAFIVSYTNEGEPFREGISIGIENQDYDKGVMVMLEDREAKKLRDFLNAMYPIKANL